MKAILINVEGGLGNQLFQIATCYHLAKINNLKAFYTSNIFY